MHYVSRGSADGVFLPQCRAAIITEVSDPNFGEGEDHVGLVVLNPTGLFFHPLDVGGCRHDEQEKAGGSWHWPERV